MEAHFGEIRVPKETVVEMKAGKRRNVERKFFPGYVLVQMEMSDETLAPRAQHAEGDRLRRRLLEGARPADAGGGRLDPPSHRRVEGEAEAALRVRARRAGEDHRRTLQGVHGARSRTSTSSAPRSASSSPSSEDRLRWNWSSFRFRSSKRRQQENGKKGNRLRQAPDRGGEGHSGSARRHGARPAGRQHHGLLQGLQREDREGRGAHHPRRRHGVLGPVVLLHHEDASRLRPAQEGREAREGLRRPEQDEGRKGHARSRSRRSRSSSSST